MLGVLGRSLSVLTSPSGGAQPTPDIWLDAVAISGAVNNDVITSWSDLSGNGLHATNVLATSPVYKTGVAPGGLPALNFSGTKFLTVPPNAIHSKKSFSAYVVALPAGYTLWATLLAKTTDSNWNNGFGIYSAANNYVAWFNTYTGQTVTVNPTVGNFSVFSIRRDDALGQGHSAINLGSGLVASPTFAIPNDRPLEIGTQSIYYFNGYIAEVRFFGRFLEASEHTATVSALMEKWGII